MLRPTVWNTHASTEHCLVLLQAAFELKPKVCIDVALTVVVCLQGKWFLELPSLWQYPYVAQLCIGSTLMPVLVPSLACTHRYLCHILIWPTMMYHAESKSRPDRSQCAVNTLVMLPWACVDAALFVATACRFTVAFKLSSDPWGLLAISKVC